MTILVTGGAGYIGSHTVLALLENNKDVIILDNLSNSSEESINRVAKITGKKPKFYNGDILDVQCLRNIFENNNVESVVHFAGLKSVSESISSPIEYYKNNVNGTIILLEEMKRKNIRNFIFSSSATVYGYPQEVPIRESFEIGGTTNPYGTSKYMVEKILEDLARADPHFSIIALRYFNPVGAHESGLIGEDPNGIPNNLLPYIAQVAIGKLDLLSIFGNDYDTIDGTGVRDYIHVMDLADGHLKAIEHLGVHKGYTAYNLGTGIGYSVIEIMNAFEKASGHKIPHRFVPRREGDISECWSSSKLAEEKLGWRASRDLYTMMVDAWNWQKKNPNGYK